MRRSKALGSRFLTVLMAVSVLGSVASAAEKKGLSSGKPIALINDDLSGWIAEGKTSFEVQGEEIPVWTVKDGVIHCAGKGFGFLRFDQKVDDFELRVEYNFTPGCNSGIGLRTVPYTGAHQTRPSRAGYELQILDEERVDVLAYKKPRLSMSLYGHVERPKNYQKPAGQWNVVDIRCQGPRIWVVLNGQTIHDLDQRDIKTIKNKPLSGYVCLQNHGHPIDFRNVRLKRLAKLEPASENKADEQ